MLPSPFRYNTETVSSEVLSCMKQQMTVLNSSTGNHSFLLDDDATLPFAAADVLNALDDKVRHGCNTYEVSYAYRLLSFIIQLIKSFTNTAFAGPKHEHTSA